MSFPPLRHNPSTAYLVHFALFILGTNGPVQAFQGVGALPVPATDDLLQIIKKIHTISAKTDGYFRIKTP